jgi:hypothetical protein
MRRAVQGWYWFNQMMETTWEDPVCSASRIVPSRLLRPVANWWRPGCRDPYYVILLDLDLDLVLCIVQTLQIHKQYKLYYGLYRPAPTRCTTSVNKSCHSDSRSCSRRRSRNGSRHRRRRRRRSRRRCSRCCNISISCAGKHRHRIHWSRHIRGYLAP